MITNEQVELVVNVLQGVFGSHAPYNIMPRLTDGLTIGNMWLIGSLSQDKYTLLKCEKGEWEKLVTCQKFNDILVSLTTDICQVRTKKLLS